MQLLLATPTVSWLLYMLTYELINVVQAAYCYAYGRHEAITWTNVDSSSVKSCAVHLRSISQGISPPSITEINFKDTCLKFHQIIYQGQIS